MQRTVIFLAFLAPASVLLFFSLFPTADPSAELPIFHFYIVVFAAFTAAVSSMLLSTALKPIAQTRHTLASLAFAFMGIIFFTHALPTPGALTSSFHPALKWSAWLTLLGGGIIFVLAGLDRPDSKPKWLRVRYIVAFMTGFMLVYLVIIMFFPQLLSQIDNAAMPWHENAVFLGTLALWLVASVQLLLIGRKTGNKTDGVLTLVAFWLALATVSMFQFPLWKISWWMYHFLLLASFLLTFYILVTEYEQARRFRLLRYYVAFSLVLTAGLTLATSYLFAEFASSSMPAKNLNSGLAVLPAPVNHADHGEAIAPEQGLQVLETSEQPGDTATPQAREGPEDDSQALVVISARITGLLIATATMGSLFAALLLVVRRADRIINQRTEELALAYADLRHSEAVREDLASMIVHDLRNPLTAISTNLGLISHSGSKVEASKRQRFLDNTKAAVRRMSSLIDEILAVSKIEAGELQPNLEMVPVNELLTNGIETFATQAISEQKQLTCNCPSELSAQMDADLMGRVVENLVNNAFKYTEPGGNISVSALRENGSVRLCIRDDGIGVPDNFKERIFDKFAQGSKDDNRPHRSGTGLGLAFCRFVVGAHHGRIWVADVPGGGSDFVIQLPISQQEIGQ